MPFEIFDQIRPSLRPLRDALDPSHAAPAPAIHLRVHGGMPSERLDLTFTLHADDTIGVNLIDRLAGRQASRTATPPRARLDVLRSAILKSGILSVEATPARIPPDSVIGELRIQDASAVGEWSFIGDIGQAEAAREFAPLQLIRAVGPLMTLGKEVLRVDNINPYLIADAPGPLYVAAIDHDPRGRDIEGEHLVLYNLRADPLPVGDYEVRDLIGHTYKIPAGTIIEPHGVLRVWTGAGTNGPLDLFQQRKQAIWNPGDIAIIRDPGGAEIARRTYNTRR